MIERRNVMGTGLVAGLAAFLAPDGAAAAPAAQQDGAVEAERVARAVDDLRQSVSNGFDALQNSAWGAVSRIRAQQHAWLRATQKYPDFIEVGVELWDALHDWHVRYQQPINVARMTDGRYAMVFMFTTVILRPELMPDYLGLPYDTPPRA